MNARLDYQSELTNHSLNYYTKMYDYIIIAIT